MSLAIGLASGVVLARVVRAEVARVLTQDYIVTAAASGSSTFRTVWRHIIPNIAPTVIVQLSLIAALAVLAEAALSYVGATPVSTPSWGRMLETLQQSMTIHPGALVFPGLAVVLATLGFNLLGDGLRDAIDPSAPRPRRRRRRRRSPASSTWRTSRAVSLLEVDGLVVEIGGRRVVDEVSFAVPDGGRLGVIGESGSGKTLTALSIVGLAPDVGDDHRAASASTATSCSAGPTAGTPSCAATASRWSSRTHGRRSTR